MNLILLNYFTYKRKNRLKIRRKVYHSIYIIYYYNVNIYKYLDYRGKD